MSADGLCPDCDMPVPADVYTCPHCGQPLDFVKPARAAGPPRRAAVGRRAGSGCGTTVILALLILTASCAKPAPAIPTAPPGGALMAFGKHVIAVELAVDADQWQKGLMGRRHMGVNNGMLFVFPSPERLGFWMKDTLIPLQIAFLQHTTGQSYRVAKLFEMTPCTADPCHIYDPGVLYDVALEANAGWFSRNLVHVGSTGRLGRAPGR